MCFAVHLTSGHIPDFPNRFKPDRTLNTDGLSEGMVDAIVRLNSCIEEAARIIAGLASTKGHLDKFIDPLYQASGSYMHEQRLGNNNHFDNRDFWNRRYLENPSLGSGIGSRGANMLHKRDIISRFLHSIQPRSMLDVGCGDHEVLSALPFTGRYTGLNLLK